ncbi:MAG: alcohol dehydrogenase catalytic domain-containing protein [Ktedonobacteraceae bacterium]
MWTSTLDLDPTRVIPTKLLGLFWRGAYFSSFAPLQVQNLPRQPLPAANWVRVRNSLAGICGSDLHLIFADGDFNVAPAAIPGHRRSYPGHEVVGEVIEVGEDVHTLHVGDRVVLQNGPNCITAGVQPPCRSCAGGNYGLCEIGELPGPQPIGGGWSEEMLLHEQQIFRVSSDISDEQAVLLEPAAVAVHAVLRRLPQAGEQVLIIGAGTIGLLTLQVIHALAPGVQVNVMARHAFQVERAANMGAKVIYPENSYQQVQQSTSARLYRGLTGNKMLLGGYDVIFDTIGSKRTTHDALRWTRAGGTVVMVGLYLHQMRIDLTPIWFQEINLIGTMGHGMETWPIGSSEQRSTFEITAEMIAREQIKPEELITHRYLLNEYREALMDAREKTHNRVVKVVFDFSSQPASVVPNVRAVARQRITSAPVSQPLVPAGEPAYSQPAPTRSPEAPAPVPAEQPDPAWSLEETAPVPAEQSAPAWPFEETAPMPAEQPVAAERPLHAEEEDETKTVIAPALWQSPFHPFELETELAAPIEHEESPQTAPRHESFNVASQYGSLPGFQPDLEQLGIPAQPADNEEMADNPPVDVTAHPTEVVPVVNKVEHISEEKQDVSPAAPDFTDTPPDDAMDEYAWAQYLTPQPDDEGSQTAPATPSAFTHTTEDEAASHVSHTTEEDDAAPVFTHATDGEAAPTSSPDVTSATDGDAPLDVTNTTEVEVPPALTSTSDGEAASDVTNTAERESASDVTPPTDGEAAPTLPVEHVENPADDGPQTVVVSSPRHARGRRKTADLKKAGRKDANKQKAQSSGETANDPT